ncbi:MAG TPA: membrane protein insertion efficiency factor YidD [Candidatus Binatus sp.]|nr:membrane protein insertion efficiency factor YidD [Candidatus Binatus sp.]
MRGYLTPNPFPLWEGGPEKKLGAVPRWVAAGAIAIYRAAVSPLIHAIYGPACRFEPSCSEYAREAITRWGVVRGGAMALWRIARCNPVGGHGWDPVRERETDKETESSIARGKMRAEQGPSPSSPLQGEAKRERVGA